ncbi:MAG: hemerythrin family protein [Campylobacterales bacterium]|nr:hemerythrin family protein [Campylobacterales bacterium]
MGIIYAEQVEYMSLDSMQETHENEIALINEIDKIATLVSMKKASYEELEIKLDEYIAHVKEHFSKEEELMEKYDFPHAEMHEMAHQMFLADLAYATRQWKSYNDINKIVTFVRKTPEWIVMHVNSVDAPTADYIVRKIEHLKNS